MGYNFIFTQTEDSVCVITLNRPLAHNALNSEITSELASALDDVEKDDAIGCVVLTGGDAAFAAGADIKEIKDKNFADVYGENFITQTWERISSCRKPTIAAVSGYAVGGGCELALMCDIIVASETAQFSLPETRIGVIPGAGGTQRLTRVVGKAIAMDIILSGRVMDAQEAKLHGLVSRVTSKEDYLVEAIALGKKITASSRPVIMLAKEAVNHAFETHLAEGVYMERRLLYSTFALDDRKEGMNAFFEKRKPVFNNR